MLSLTDVIKIILHEQRSESDFIKISFAAELQNLLTEFTKHDAL